MHYDSTISTYFNVVLGSGRLMENRLRTLNEKPRCPHLFYKANQPVKIDLPVFPFLNLMLPEPWQMLKGNLAAKLSMIFHKVMQYVMLL